MAAAGYGASASTATASLQEQRLRRVENAMVRHINGMSSPLGAPVAIYGTCPVQKKGKATGQLRRLAFLNPEPGVRLTHVTNLGTVFVDVHHRDSSARYTDFGLVFAPLQLVSLRLDGSPGEPYRGGPYTARIEFKTSDDSVLSEVRVAGCGQQVDTHKIPDPEHEDFPQGAAPKKSLLSRVGGFFRGAASSSARHADKAKKSLSQFEELVDEDDGDDAPTCYEHDCVKLLRDWLGAEIAQPLEGIIKDDIEEHKGKGF
eukprot:TRINITY_DN47376_c0_g1_i1.p1 TRINITY_DN47376_c0_g1~~TRINITY_DN47376_c0_g1_i1.p1  ORF type:complete len:269 (-),score=62.85 TRINITY_DN47376_c0_g1_i1:63-839(-)